MKTAYEVTGMIVSQEVEKLRKAHERRDQLDVRVVHGASIPNNVTVIRVSWHESRLKGGPGGGWVGDTEIVQWYSWGGDEWCGSHDTKKGAIEIALFFLGLQEKP